MEKDDHCRKHERPRYGGSGERVDEVVLRPGGQLAIQELVAVARGNPDGTYPLVRLDGDWQERCQRSRGEIEAALEQAVQYLGQAAIEEEKLRKSFQEDPKALGMCNAEKDRAIDDLYRGIVEGPIANKISLFVYGVTTGFGSNKDKPLSDANEISALQRNILLSHAGGTGKALPTEVVRGMLLLRLRTFIEGRSGVRPELVKLLLDMLNRRVHPFVPEQGSVGASGDLCPMAHIGLTLIGEGYAWVGDYDAEGINVSSLVRTPGEAATSTNKAPKQSREALIAAELQPLDCLAAKEGLALTNGAVMSAALTALAVYDADVLLGTANLCGALALQAMMGFTRAYDVKVHVARRHPTQVEVAEHVMWFARDSGLTNRAREVQDPYSLRCLPQVHGAVLGAIEHVWEVMSREINAVTDNPLFFVEVGEREQLTYPEERRICLWDAYSCGNFHGEPIALAADYLKMAVAELASISERRTQLLLDSNHNRGLPENLPLGKPGLNSGLMIAQYTAASLVSENKNLAHPAVVDSIPTSANSEDHVSMSSIASRHLRRVVDNVRNVLAIELITGLQAVELHARLINKLREGDDPGYDISYRRWVEGNLAELLSEPCKRVLDYVRKELQVPFIVEDTQLWNLVAVTQQSIQKGEILQRASTALV